MEDSSHLEVDLDGETVLIDPTDINGNEWHAIKQVCGLRPRQVFEGMEDYDFDALAALVWTVKRRTSPDVEFDEVRGGLTLQSLDAGSDGEVDDGPPSDGDASSEI